MMEQFMLLHSYALYDLFKRIFNSVSQFIIFVILLIKHFAQSVDVEATITLFWF